MYDRETRSEEKFKVACSPKAPQKDLVEGKVPLSNNWDGASKNKDFLSYLPLRGLTRLSVRSALCRDSKFQLWNKSVFYYQLKTQHAILFIRFKNHSSNCGWFGSKDLSQIVPVEMDIPWKQQATFSPGKSSSNCREQLRQAGSPFSITVSAVVDLFIKSKRWDQWIKKFILSLRYLL